MSTLTPRDRLDDALVARALHGGGPMIDDDAQDPASEFIRAEAEAFERAAAATQLAYLGAVPSSMPESIRRRLHALTGSAAGSTALSPSRSSVAGLNEHGPIPFRRVAVPASGRRGPTWLAYAGWAVAACVALSAIALWPGAASPSPRSTPVAEMYRQMASRPDVVKASWSDWDNPEVSGVKGEVVWCDREQAGYMRLVGLPKADPTRAQYQLWIVDRRGLFDKTGQSARISGGIFNGDDGELIVPISPAIPVQGAAAFAITVEEPGGTWVSDMSRRVAIAQVARR